MMSGCLIAIHEHTTLKLHPFFTVLFSLDLVILFWILFRLFTSRDALSSLRYIGPSAGRLMETHMELYAGYERNISLERALYTFLFGTPQTVMNNAIRVYNEVLNYYAQEGSKAPSWGILSIKARLLIVIAEKRDKHSLRLALVRFGENPEEEVIESNRSLTRTSWKTLSPL